MNTCGNGRIIIISSIGEDIGSGLVCFLPFLLDHPLFESFFLYINKYLAARKSIYAGSYSVLPRTSRYLSKYLPTYLAT